MVIIVYPPVSFQAPTLHTSPTVTATTITITGSVPSGSVATDFIVQWQRDSSIGCSNNDAESIVVPGDFTTYLITGLEPGNMYNITVRVFNVSGISNMSNVITIKTLETGKRAQLPLFM